MKDSGIEWIGDIPEHWEICKLKYSDQVIMGQSPSSDDYIEDENAMPFLQGNADFKLLYPDPRIYCNTANKTSKVGDVLLSVRAPIGAVNISDTVYGIGRGLCAIRSISSIPKFLYYQSLTKEEELNYLGTGSTYKAIAVDDVANTYFTKPPKSEQIQIAAFLDEKTAKIDSLIGKKQRKIELLREKRKALINHAVTKGPPAPRLRRASLNPDVPMKDSGVEWIGEIPEEWEATRIKSIFTIKKNIAGDTGHDVLSVTQNGIKIKDIESGEGQLSMDYSKYQLVEKGDFVMNHMDLLTGYIDISKYNGVTSPDYRVFYLSKSECIAKFYLYLFQYCYEDEIFFPYGRGSAQLGRWRLPRKEFYNFRFPQPPLEEQKDIAEFLDDEVNRILKQINYEQQKIDLLQEYRQSLISEAVTGKIDVREEVTV